MKICCSYSSPIKYSSATDDTTKKVGKILKNQRPPIFRPSYKENNNKKIAIKKTNLALSTMTSRLVKKTKLSISGRILRNIYLDTFLIFIIFLYFYLFLLTSLAQPSHPIFLYIFSGRDGQLL